MKNLTLICTFICLVVSANAQDFVELIRKDKDDVLSELTLNDNVSDISTGENKAGYFFYEIHLKDETLAGAYFREGICFDVTHFVTFDQYKEEFIEWKGYAEVFPIIDEINGTTFYNNFDEVFISFTIQKSGVDNITSYIIRYQLYNPSDN